MAGWRRNITRRSFLGAGAALLPMAAKATAQVAGQSKKGATFPADSRKYADPTTEFDVYRLTSPEYSSVLPACENRSIGRNGTFLVFTCDRSGSPQAFRLDLKSAQQRQLTDVDGFDAGSLTLTPDNRSICYFAGRSLYLSSMATLHDRELYKIPDGWERAPGMSVGPDGTHATFSERKGDASRVRMISLVQGAARTVTEAPFTISSPVPRPMRAQILYRQADEALWLVNQDGQQNRKLRLAPGRVGPAMWPADGKTILYLNLPDDKTQLNSIREFTPDTGADKLVAKTSQFASFGFNHDTSVFAGASLNVASPYLLLLLRITRRELTLCEHKATQPAAVAPIFSPNSQRLYFQSDREGKPTLYDMHIEKWVEQTDWETNQ